MADSITSLIWQTVLVLTINAKIKLSINISGYTGMMSGRKRRGRKGEDERRDRGREEQMPHRRKESQRGGRMGEGGADATQKERESERREKG